MEQHNSLSDHTYSSLNDIKGSHKKKKIRNLKGGKREIFPIEASQQNPV